VVSVFDYAAQQHFLLEAAFRDGSNPSPRVQVGTPASASPALVHTSLKLALQKALALATDSWNLLSKVCWTA